MKRVFVVLLMVVLLLTGISAYAYIGIFDSFRQHYSVEAVRIAESTKLPDSLLLSEKEEEIYRLGVAAGYDRHRQITEGLEEQTYVLNIRSMKFHDTLCMGGASIKDENRKVVQCTREELINGNGYDWRQKDIDQAAFHHVHVPHSHACIGGDPCKRIR